jgi:hypothetical protein
MPIPPEIMALIDDEEDNYEWPCGCVDYHYADCPSRDGSDTGMSKDDYLDYYADNPEELY